MRTTIELTRRGGDFVGFPKPMRLWESIKGPCTLVDQDGKTIAVTLTLPAVWTNPLWDYVEPGNRRIGPSFYAPIGDRHPLRAFGWDLLETYEHELPEEHKRLVEIIGNVDDPFVEVNIQHLPPEGRVYHFDNHEPPCFSTILVLRKGPNHGGNLHLPEYDALIVQDDRTLVLLDGRKCHGVTRPNLQPGEDRVSFVFWPRFGMRK